MMVKLGGILAEYNIAVGVTKVDDRPPAKDKKKRVEKNDNYSRFMRKLENKEYDKFNSVDFLYFFRFKAECGGKKYLINNFQIDAHWFKLLKDKYTNDELVTMVCFLFDSEQSYIVDPHVKVLYSGWTNKIYEDSKKWLAGEYKDIPVKKKEAREWKKGGNKVKVGEW